MAAQSLFSCLLSLDWAIPIPLCKRERYVARERERHNIKETPFKKFVYPQGLYSLSEDLCCVLKIIEPIPANVSSSDGHSSDSTAAHLIVSRVLYSWDDTTISHHPEFRCV